MEHTDKWRDFFQENKEAFEEEVPDLDALWQRVDKKMPQELKPFPKKNPLRYWVAATVLLAVACGGLILDRLSYPRGDEPELGVAQTAVDDFAGTVAAFHAKIEERKATLASYQKNEELPLASFQIDIAQLGAQYEKLQQTASRTQDSKVLRAMIFNLQLQLDLLEQQLEIVESVEGAIVNDVEI